MEKKLLLESESDRNNLKITSESSKERKKLRRCQTSIRKKVSDIIIMLQRVKPKWSYTMIDFESGHFPWLLPQGKTA